MTDNIIQETNQHESVGTTDTEGLRNMAAISVALKHLTSRVDRYISKLELRKPWE